MKTPIEMPHVFWLMTIEDEDVREKAIRNCESDKPYNGLDLSNSLSWSISSSFVWFNTPEGISYWDAVCLKAKD